MRASIDVLAIIGTAAIVIVVGLVVLFVRQIIRDGWER
jgi:hypothetical protein